jgi:hypothetical protein
MANELASALDQRIREILQTAYQRASLLGDAYKVETGKDHPLLRNGRSKVAAASVTQAPAGPRRAGRRKRERRSPETLKRQAMQIVELVKSRGKAGIDGKSIRAAFPKVGQSISAFVKKFGNASLTTQGHGMGQRYYAPKA